VRVTKRIKILIVEDEDIIRLLLTEAMTDEGFVVVNAGSAEEALTRLSNGEIFDILMTDIQLTGALNGLDLAAAVRIRTPSMPIIFTTGQPDRMKPWQTGTGDLFIPKPYRPSQVAAAARRMIAS
jgi:DNA-binding NtrC family response regulator